MLAHEGSQHTASGVEQAILNPCTKMQKRFMHDQKIYEIRVAKTQAISSFDPCEILSDVLLLYFLNMNRDLE